MCISLMFNIIQFNTVCIHISDDIFSGRIFFRHRNCFFLWKYFRNLLLQLIPTIMELQETFPKGIDVCCICRHKHGICIKVRFAICFCDYFISRNLCIKLESCWCSVTMVTVRLHFTLLVLEVLVSIWMLSLLVAISNTRLIVKSIAWSRRWRSAFCYISCGLGF